MGGGIAQVAAVQAGCKVVLVDVKQEQLDKCMGLMDKLLAKDVAKDRLTEADKAAALARITTSTDMSAFGGASFLIEAATENVGLKLDLFRAMDSVAPSGAILASNTSSISITKMAAATARPEAVIGMHFMNPVPVMKLVEVIPGLATSEATLADTLALATAMGKTCTQSRDIPGFIANRILMPYINEAVQTLYEGIGTVEAIDTSMKLGTNVPMGPLTLADFIGLDTCLAIMQVLHSELGDSKYRPSPLLVQHVNAGWLGKKSGRGFYDYRK
ncbi:putative 3-hydroxyacyl-CoA dehydrogenase [Emiliania huxleyi CCMP1516]|uniref:3-hydroxybutyryl-CoA dehydrogenase n=3 Tax=Emiliania huxleyi TaxID=2903 RepID=A0A0D3JUM0_EMIH1|nr:putative 3-hydroxyacyl-CoA dehydrogenase [Emiliania huxleyi CCMP1516]EOD27205.1 putative 3-hydroxyacyl-CoA dehydrogenase [Emiliania huxleyi CCMP1516]|eukprot:XP_005779634.1 putative 3-hydroxyacyl-CoA dehydrogenase [Emiliania huxleyi CCMP1516]